MAERPAVQADDMVTVVIVAAGAGARVQLSRLLEAHEVFVAGEAASFAAARVLVEQLQPDLLFVDLQTVHPSQWPCEAEGSDPPAEPPGGGQAPRPVPALIVVSDNEEGAVAAFEHGAVDYLVRPIAAERLQKALARAYARLAPRPVRAVLPAEGVEPGAAPLQRLPIRTTYAVKLVRIEEIDYAESRNRQVFVRTGAIEYPTNHSLKQLEALLPADHFFRVHDSYVVNLERVEEVSNLGSNAYQLRLSSGARLPVGRTRCAELRRRLALEDEAAV